MPFSLLEELLGRPVPIETRDLLAAYSGWLEAEAMLAGGIGPHEAGRMWERHILDSAAFSLPWSQPPRTCTDLGSGVGLPGLVLAILWPGTEVKLVDRSRRRVTLLRRAIRVLDLPNVKAIEQDVFRCPPNQNALVMRATLPPDSAIPQFGQLLGRGGRAVLGLSRTQAPEGQILVGQARENGLAASVKSVTVLDPPAWMLIMSKS